MGLIAVLDTGVGGLSTLHQVLVDGPRNPVVFVAGEQLFPLAERAPESVRPLIVALANELARRGVQTVIPTAAALWPFLPDLKNAGLGVLEPREAIVRTLIGHRASPSEAVVLAPANVIDAGFLARWFGPELEVRSSRGLAPAIERRPERDDQLMSGLRSACAGLPSLGRGLIIAADSHVGMVTDLVRRVSNGLPVADLASAFADMIETGENSVGSDPLVDPSLVVVGDFARHVESFAWTSHQIRFSRIETLCLEPTSDDKMDLSDCAVLFYGAVERGDDSELEHYIGRDARVEPGGQTVTEWAAALRADGRPRVLIDELLFAGRTVGVTGVLLVAGSRRRFGHRLRLEGGRVVSVRVDLDEALE